VLCLSCASDLRLVARVRVCRYFSRAFGIFKKLTDEQVCPRARVFVSTRLLDTTCTHVVTAQCALTDELREQMYAARTCDEL
jgi:hypothetical protein